MQPGDVIPGARLPYKGELIRVMAVADGYAMVRFPGRIPFVLFIKTWVKEEASRMPECPKGGAHDWGIDGAHSNQFCKKCFADKPR